MATPMELHERMAGGALYREAYRARMSLSAFLEREDPSEKHNDGLDAFERQLKVANIVTNSDPDRGLFADTFDAFDKDANTRALVHEWAVRQWKKASTGRNVSTRANAYTSSETAAGTVLQPITYVPDPRVQQIAPAIPLAEVVAITTPIEGAIYEAFYLTNDAPSQRLVRVSQAAEFPRAKLVGGDHTIRLQKYGRTLEVTYEVLRRQRIDLVALHIKRMAVQAETDKVAAAIYILVNGDGNSNTAATSYNLTTLDAAAVAGTLTLKGWLNFKLQFANPYAMTTMFANAAMGLQAQMLNTGTANIPLTTLPPFAGFGQFTPINPQLGDQVRLGISTDAPSNTLVGFDKRFALEYVTEIGADLTEVERWSTRQVQALTISEVNGFATLDPNAVKVMAVNA